MNITKLVDYKNPTDVCSNLEDFINLVNVYELETRLPSHQASDLIEQVKNILQDIDCTTVLNFPQSFNHLTESIFDLPLSDISSMGSSSNRD